MNYKIIHVFTSEEARFEGRPLQEAIIERVRGLKTAARCMVTRADAGCYENGEVATRKIEILSFNMPVHIEIVLPEAEAALLLPQIERMVEDGIVGVGSMTVSLHRTRKHLVPRQLRVRDAMTRSPRSVPATASAADAVRLLLSGDFNAVPVVDEGGRPVGIVTQGDLIERAGMPVRLGLMAEFERHHLDELMAALESRRVGEVMTQPVTTVGEDAGLADAVEVMLSKGLKRLPVVDAQGRLTGILARLDVFRTATREAPDWKAVGDGAVTVSGLSCVREIMRRDMHAVRPETTVDEIIRVIDDNDIQRVAVVDAEGRLLGLVSDRDLLAAFSEHRAGLWERLAGRLPFTEVGRRHQAFVKAALKATAAQVMRTELATVTEGTTIDEAVRLMVSRKIKRLPVVDEAGRFKGLVSRDSLLRAGTATMKG